MTGSDVSAPSATGSYFWPLFVWGGRIVGLVFVTIVGLIYYHQDKLLYIPNPPGFPKTPEENPPGFTSPEEWTTEGKLVRRKGSTSQFQDKIQTEDSFIKTEDGVSIHTWLLIHEDTEIKHHPVLIYFHGNAGNMGFRLKNAVDMFSKVKINILMMDYRGYGKSEGTPTEKGLQNDADAVLKHVTNHPRLKDCPVIVFGRSLGGAVSFYLADKYPKLVHGIIVENTFLSISAMVDILMPYVKPLKNLLLKINWRSEEIIANLAQPMYFISGDADTLVPPSHMKKLYELALKSVHREFFSVLGGGHNDSWEIAGAEYYIRMRQFVDQYIRKEATSDIVEKDDSIVNDRKETQEPITVAPIEVIQPLTDEEGDGDYFIVENSEGTTRPGIPTMNQNFAVN
mmetsp:Transcript_20747/g.22559  ORF Transcript_20747/g.22559 Transcript_20747/m.22559 type:complete len:398 (+) Transcript_20747:62-1255(+)